MNKRIVIEIDEDLYQGIKETDFEFARQAVRSFQATIADAIRKGIPLDAEVLKALEDVRAEITGNLESIIGKYDSNTKPEDMPSRKIERNNGRTEAIDIINRKIKEIKHE